MLRPRLAFFYCQVLRAVALPCSDPLTAPLPPLPDPGPPSLTLRETEVMHWLMADG